MCSVSVVIPVFKVGKYIENSMKSICSQTYRDFEVLLIDNNSPDDSIERAKKILTGSGIHYRVLKQPIQGLPAARNMGIKEAKGDWIISIDPDDTVSSRFLADLYECAIANNLDIVFSKYSECGKDMLFDFPEENKKDVIRIYDKDEIMNLLLVRKLPLMVSNMLINRDAFWEKGCWFDEDIILGADLINLWRILANTDRIAYLDKSLYNHLEHPDSLMTTLNWKKIDLNIMGYDRLYRYLKEHYSEQMGKWVYSRAVYAFLATVCVYGGKNMYKEYLEKYYTEDVHLILQSFPDKRIQYLNGLLRMSPNAFYIINKAFRKPNSVAWKAIAKRLHNN